MDKNTKDPLYSDSYTSTDFVWGQTLGEGKFTNYKTHHSLPPCLPTITDKKMGGLEMRFLI